MLRRSVLAIVVILCLPAPSESQQACGPGHLVTLGADGAVVSGAKEALLSAVSGGMPIRVGWSLDTNDDRVPEVSHWADGAFLSVFEGEVFAQIDDIQRQQPVRGQARIGLPAGRQRWTGLLGTNGLLESHFDDGSAPTRARVATTWCVDPRTRSCEPEWRLVYRHDSGGNPISGTKQSLLDAIRRGAPVRFAWGFSGTQPNGPVSVEHSAEPVFLTIMQGEHVFVQLPEHIAQLSYARPEGARFESASVMWRGLMGTDGTFDAVYVDRATGREVRRLPQRVGLAWFAQVPPSGCAAAAPLDLAVPGGVRAVAPPQPD